MSQLHEFIKSIFNYEDGTFISCVNAYQFIAQCSLEEAKEAVKKILFK